jgi:LysR family transcriptional regulator, nitrogen assimilation regulatory protein
MQRISEMRKEDGSFPQLGDLRCFLVAAEYKSLTAAAAASGVAQSAFSRQLARLEQVLGGRLLHRTGRGVSLTELGERVLPRAKALVEEAQGLANDASGRWNRPAGVVDVALLPSMARPVAGRLFTRVAGQFPDIRLRLREAYSGEVQAMLAEGRIDVGTVNRYRPLRREAQEAVLTSPMCLILPAGAPLAREKTLKFSALATLPLVMPLQPNSLRAVIEEIASRRGLTLHVALEVDSSTAMKDAVLHCKLAATLPAHAVQAELVRGEVAAVPITHPGIRQTTFVETTRRRPASAAVRVVERELRDLVAHLRDGNGG